ncbi:DUF4132 domain-containing protein [Actinoplanes derwentensis]|uniref:DUF4132 domain-containing protein n=1 Tax=Actinoplanes derwentensis TaxID=113562 RepID=A0A1H2CWW7_9ACTN|nr:DUF4132 domain-containing protein [Actinoplanes derwentensis]GID87897.1 hypothetical protein Ade03nite_68210 [Actinoplanes derwentensis]SDT74951.1 protein of unknown function [Actinoplanes derwentensis]
MSSFPSAPQPIDEDTFVLPASWQRYRAARRGTTGIGRFTPAATARATIDERITERGPTLDSVLAARTTEEPTRLAAREWLAGDPEARPFGAAVAGFILESYGSHWWHDASMASPLADVWITERGLPFAAEAAVTLMSLIIEDDFAPPYPRSTMNDKPGIRHRRPGEAKSSWAADSSMRLLLRVRHALAATSDEEFAAVVTALEPYRQAHPYTRAATSVLVPGRRDWFEEDVRWATGTAHDGYLATILLTAASTPDDVRALFPVATAYAMVNSLPLLTTMLDGVGAAAAPALFNWLGDATGTADPMRRLLSALVLLPGDEVTSGLIDRIDAKYVVPALLEHADRFPARSLRLLAEAAGKRAVADLLRGHLVKHADLIDQVLPRLGPEAADRVGKLVADAGAVAPAPLAMVPPVLASPPWLRVHERPKPVVITGLTCTDEPTVDWLPGQREDWAATRIPEYEYVDETEGDPAQLLRDILAGRSAMRRARAAVFFRDQPDEIARPALVTWKPDPVGWYLRPVAARFELAALPTILDAARRDASDMAQTLLPFASPAIAVLVADWLARLKSMQAEALEWLLRHPAAAARALVPPALGKAGKARRQAETALFALNTNGQADAVRTAAAGYGAEAAAAIETLLATDPAAFDPVKVPEAPTWAAPALLRPVMLRDGSGRLPDEAVTNLVVALAMSRLGAPCPGLDDVEEKCEPASLAAFTWSLFAQWQASGADSKQIWALDALGLFGDDDTVRNLTPLIMLWPGQSAHQRAVTGLHILAGIGTDVALMHLHRVAQRAKFAGLKSAAQERLQAVAERLGLTAEQLADRLVPDFGLAADGSLVLDYGPRQFTVGFDEQLRPFVADGTGKRLKALPKPGVKDDQVLAPAAAKQFTALKKDVRTVAVDQVRRLEQAMVTNRRWSGAEFHRLFVEHPLLWHIVRRLVWVRFDEAGKPGGAFRVAEDRSLSTVDDDTTTLADDAVVGVAHPLHLGAEGAAWAGVFADYEILQPFPQLGRPVLTLTEQERTASTLPRFHGITVPATKLIGLERKGWRRETPQDAGVQSQIEFTVEPGREVVIAIKPGIAIGYLDMFPDQEVTEVFLHDGTGSRWWNENKRGHVNFGSLDPVTASEILRDLTDVTGS